MKLGRSFLLGIAILSTICCSAGGSWSAVDNVRQVVAARVTVSPVLDGKMGDPAWAKASETGGFTALRSAVKTPSTPTYVKVLSDGKALYIGFRCVEPKLSETKAPNVSRDGSVWAQDGVEVVIDPSGDRRECYDLVGGLSGSQCDAKLTILTAGAVNQDLGWNGDWDLKTWRGDGEWRAEMRIPYSAVGIDTAKNPTVGINFNRARWVGTSELSNWSPNDMYFSEPSNLGELIIPNADGSYCNVQLPRLKSVVTGDKDFSAPVLNSSDSSIQPKISFSISGPESEEGEVALGSIASGSQAVAELPIHFDQPGEYSLLIDVTDAVTGRSLYKTARYMKVTQPFVFDEALYALYYKRVDATVDVRIPADHAAIKLSLMKDGVENPIKTQTMKRGITSPTKVSFSLSGQTDGVYRLRAELIRGGKTVATAVSRAYAYKANPLISMDKDQNLIVDGKPFFPIGIYSIQNIDGSPSPDIAKEVKGAGFNCTVLYHQTWDALRPELDACQEAGIKALVYPTTVFSEWKDGLSVEQVHKDIDARRNHPALLGWYVVDEPEGIGLAPVKQVRDMYQTIKEYDQDHPCTLVIMTPTAAKDYDSSCDVMWTDPYPIPQDPITAVSETVGGGVKNIEKDKPLWCIAQAFDWSVWNQGKMGKIHRPTDDEERCMTYLALVNGAKGIIYWAYTSSKYHITDYPDHWVYMKKLAGEISSISPVLLTQKIDGKLSATANVGALETMVKKLNGDWYVFAVNSSTNPCHGSFNLSGAKSDKMEVLFENRSLSADGGSWTDEFNPLEVHVYKMTAR